MDKISYINNLILETKQFENISLKGISDGHHTYGELYEQRMILFCTICNLLPDIS